MQGRYFHCRIFQDLRFFYFGCKDWSWRTSHITCSCLVDQDPSSVRTDPSKSAYEVPTWQHRFAFQFCVWWNMMKWCVARFDCFKTCWNILNINVSFDGCLLYHFVDLYAIWCCSVLMISMYTLDVCIDMFYVAVGDFISYRQVCINHNGLCQGLERIVSSALSSRPQWAKMSILWSLWYRIDPNGDFVSSWFAVFLPSKRARHTVMMELLMQKVRFFTDSQLATSIKDLSIF